MTSWILIAALATQSYVCEVDGKRRVSYGEIPGCVNRVVSIDPATSPSVPLFLPGEPTLTDLEQERLELWRADPMRRGVCVVRINPAVFDADVVTTDIDGKQVKFKIWSNSPQGNHIWEVDREAWSGQGYLPQYPNDSPRGRLYISRELKTPQAIYLSLDAEGRNLQVGSLSMGGSHLVLTEQREWFGGFHGEGPRYSYAVDPTKREQLERSLLRKFPDEATYARLRQSGTALSRDTVARADSKVDPVMLFDFMYGPHLGRLKRIWAGAPPGFIDPLPGEIVDTRPHVTLERPCRW